jgi:hypothetical protein
MACSPSSPAHLALYLLANSALSLSFAQFVAYWSVLPCFLSSYPLCCQSQPWVTSFKVTARGRNCKQLHRNIRPRVWHLLSRRIQENGAYKRGWRRERGKKHRALWHQCAKLE